MCMGRWGPIKGRGSSKQQEDETKIMGEPAALGLYSLTMEEGELTGAGISTSSSYRESNTYLWVSWIKG